MSISDEAKEKARKAAQAIKDALGIQTLLPKQETTVEMETGSPRTPGFDEHQGKTMKPVAEWPPARDQDPKDVTGKTEVDHDLER